MKTAVEQLFEEMNRIRLEVESENIGALDFFNQQNEAFSKAKLMEKKQIIEAADWGALSETGERYYEDNYIADKRNQKSEGKNI